MDLSERLNQRLETLVSETERAEAARAPVWPAHDSAWAELETRLLAGSQLSVPAPRSPRMIDAVLGVDFGTTSTRIVARLPYEAGARAFAVPVPGPARYDAHPHLWTSCLWLVPNGRFSLTPQPGAALLCAVKANLLRGHGARSHDVLRVGSISASAMEAATAFLSLQIRQARGWLLTSRADVFGRGLLRWEVNLGFPAASLNDHDLSTRYRACAEIATAIARCAGPVTLDQVRAALRAESTAGGAMDGTINLVPEIAAATLGFARSARQEDGLYVLIDVGGGTLDFCAFNLFRRGDDLRCPIFTADVLMLGVQPWRHCADDPALSSEFIRQIEKRLRALVWETRKTRYPSSRRWTEGLPVFLSGGGAASPPHHQAASSLDRWLRRHIENSAGASIITLPEPDNLEHQSPAGGTHRLSVALGLSHPNVDIPQVDLPMDIEDILQEPRRNSTDRFVSKDMT